MKPCVPRAEYNTLRTVFIFIMALFFGASAPARICCDAAPRSAVLTCEGLQCVARPWR